MGHVSVLLLIVQKLYPCGLVKKNNLEKEPDIRLTRLYYVRVVFNSAENDGGVIQIIYKVNFNSKLVNYGSDLCIF